MLSHVGPATSLPYVSSMQPYQKPDKTFALGYLLLCAQIKFQQNLYRILKLFFKFLSTFYLKHRDLKSDSHNRFPTRDFACWAYILDYGESKKDCLNYFRNRSAHHDRPSRDSNPGPLGEQLLD